jgi:hypothetical protein
MKRVRYIAFLSLAFFVGIVALSQILHDDSQAIGLCSNTCSCVTCGTALTPLKSCVDWMTYCKGLRLVRNCAQYCNNQGPMGLLPVEY